MSLLDDATLAAIDNTRSWDVSELDLRGKPRAKTLDERMFEEEARFNAAERERLQKEAEATMAAVGRKKKMDQWMKAQDMRKRLAEQAVGRKVVGVQAKTETIQYPHPGDPSAWVDETVVVEYRILFTDGGSITLRPQVPPNEVAPVMYLEVDEQDPKRPG